MKLIIFKTCKILFLCALLSQTIMCSSTEAEGKFLMKAGFLKHKKPSTINKTPTQTPKIEAVNLMEKSSTIKSQAKTSSAIKQDMSSLDSLALKLGNQHESENPNDPAPLDLEIGTGPVWVTGWVKYFKYFPTSETSKLTPSTTPRQFMTNPHYMEQYKLNPQFDPKEKSEDELNNLSTYITDKHQFYAKLLKNQLIILSSRDVNIY